MPRVNPSTEKTDISNFHPPFRIVLRNLFVPENYNLQNWATCTYKNVIDSITESITAKVLFLASQSSPTCQGRWLFWVIPHRGVYLEPHSCTTLNSNKLPPFLCWDFTFFTYNITIIQMQLLINVPVSQSAYRKLPWRMALRFSHASKVCYIIFSDSLFNFI